ncbi:MAG: sigma-70 family RNA polymerase sigma factor [Gammaproteobacteria bacterium]|nr:sigma-70 family RNA polymerase sigma factor [Gammaproteobacteria bacterium]MYE28317.1 sigma-70 family RNA polymerase sigma factor [Gammaproteobacteria bacterium]
MHENTLSGEGCREIQDFDHIHAVFSAAQGERPDRTVEYARPAATDPAPDSTQLYLSEIGYKPLLTAEQEVEYARAAVRGNEDCRNRMVEGNLRLVVRIATRYRWRGLSFLDVIEEGNLGLMHAVEKFDPERGFRFSTYSTWWIRHYIERGLMYQARMIRLPVHIAKELNVVKRAERDLMAVTCREPTVEEVAERTGRSPARVKWIMALNAGIYSIDAPISKEIDAPPLLQMLPEPTAPEPGNCHGRKQLRERMSAWLRELPPRQRDVLLRRYGLEGHDVDTLERVGREVGLTRERTRQVQLEALRTLKRIVARDGLAVDVLQEYV